MERQKIFSKDNTASIVISLIFFFYFCINPIAEIITGLNNFSAAFFMNGTNKLDFTVFTGFWHMPIIRVILFIIYILLLINCLPKVTRIRAVIYPVSFINIVFGLIYCIFASPEISLLLFAIIINAIVIPIAIIIAMVIFTIYLFFVGRKKDIQENKI